MTYKGWSECSFFVPKQNKTEQQEPHIQTEICFVTFKKRKKIQITAMVLLLNWVITLFKQYLSKQNHQPKIIEFKQLF